MGKKVVAGKDKPYREELRLSEITSICVGDHWQFSVKGGDYIDASEQFVQFTDADSGELIEVKYSDIKVMVGRKKKTKP